jgi:RimJ/RimL family protein N-acetyltransferase
MTSPRLVYAPLAASDLDVFHGLVVDEHVRRFLLDGAVHPRAWSAERIADSRDLFARRGVGLWLARDAASGEVVGFCGFMELDPGAGPELVYALPSRWTGRGYATEMARAAIAAARARDASAEIVASVDAPNVASVRVLERLGFVHAGATPGAFGDMLLFRLAGAGR